MILQNANMTQISTTQANPEKTDLSATAIPRSHPYLLSSQMHTPASGANASVLKKKPIAALLTQIYGEPNAKTAVRNEIFTPAKSTAINNSVV